MTPYPLSIITPAGKIFDGPVESLTAPGQEGNLGVLAKHAPIIVLLKEGVVNVKKEGTTRFFAISSGFLEVQPNSHTLILADYAVEAANLTEAEEKLKAQK